MLAAEPEHYGQSVKKQVRNLSRTVHQNIHWKICRKKNFSKKKGTRLLESISGKILLLGFELPTFEIQIRPSHRSSTERSINFVFICKKLLFILENLDFVRIMTEMFRVVKLLAGEARDFWNPQESISGKILLLGFELLTFGIQSQHSHLHGTLIWILLLFVKDDSLSWKI